MSDLFLVQHLADLSVDVSWLLRPAADGTWDSCRRPQGHRKQAKHTLRYGPDGWVLMDDTSGTILYRPAVGASQEKERPPLGPWRSVPVGKASEEECTLTDVEPIGEKMNPNALQAPFADFVISDIDDVVTIEVTLKKTPITEPEFQTLLEQFRPMLVEMGKRPRVVLKFALSMNGAPAPSMRIVKQYMKFAGEHTPLIDLETRGFAVVLKPEGFVGYAVLKIVKMVISVFQPPWELAIVPTMEEGRAFIDKVAVAEAKVLARTAESKKATKPLPAMKAGIPEEVTPSTSEGGASPFAASSNALPLPRSGLLGISLPGGSRYSRPPRSWTRSERRSE
mmetsp:Transcript_38573/g.98519  ORF Transcript_38573/g.98519 Transcript_38573/m.98519 type:complete len:337 (-) Transcript_38573:223-1233(-)